MGFQLEFSHRYVYQSSEAGITIEASLQYGEQRESCLAKVDPGSQACLFERGLGEAIGINIERGYQRRFSTLTGGLIAYGHPVELETLGLSFNSMVYFAESHTVQRNLLGREGWLLLIRLGLVDYNSELYLSVYNQ